MLFLIILSILILLIYKNNIINLITSFIKGEHWHKLKY